MPDHMGSSNPKRPPAPWYAGEHKDALLYLLIAIFFVELAIGGVSFFYGIIHATPEVEGGPPIARFPWLAWAFAAVLAPVALLLVVHLAGTWVSGVINREEPASGIPAGDPADLPENMRRFYASVRHAPTVVLLLAILFSGAALFFVDGAIAAMGRVFTALVPYIPWLATSVAALLAFCFLAHAIMVYRQRKMENEYAWRREVLAKTGLVLVDKKSIGLPQSGEKSQLLIDADQIAPSGPGKAIDIELPQSGQSSQTDNGK